MGENFYRDADGADSFDVGYPLEGAEGRSQEVFLRKEDALVFKVPRIFVALQSDISNINGQYDRKKAEFDAATFYIRVLTALEDSGIPFPDDWMVQEFSYSDGEKAIGFWQTFYRDAVENVQTPWSRCVADGERAFFQPRDSDKAVFIDWDGALHQAFLEMSGEYTWAKLDQICANILERPKLNGIK